jgi:nucleotidyltransferase/DNA polymerase involved in DNA repair
MPRLIAIHLPTWPTDRLRRRLGSAVPDAALPLVLVGQAGRRQEVTAANMAAVRAGLRVGMPASKAQALVKELVISTRIRKRTPQRSSVSPSGRCGTRRSRPPTVRTDW